MIFVDAFSYRALAFKRTDFIDTIAAMAKTGNSLTFVDIHAFSRMHVLQKTRFA